MFTDNIAALRGLVIKRERVYRQRHLDSRRWAVRRDILRDAKDQFLGALQDAIESANSEYGYTVVLRRYSSAEMETPDRDDSTLREVLKETDVLERVANCLAPGFFKCHARTVRARGAADTYYEIVARFYAGGVEAAKPPCTCVCAYLTDGFCDICGGHNVRVARQINNPEEEEDEEE